MHSILSLLPPEEFIKKHGIEELKKTQKDPEYFVKTYFAEEQDTVTVSKFPHILGTEIHITVTEPDGKWKTFKFMKLK